MEGKNTEAQRVWETAITSICNIPSHILHSPSCTYIRKNARCSSLVLIINARTLYHSCLTNQFPRVALSFSSTLPHIHISLYQYSPSPAPPRRHSPPSVSSIMCLKNGVWEKLNFALHRTWDDQGSNDTRKGKEQEEVVSKGEDAKAGEVKEKE